MKKIFLIWTLFQNILSLSQNYFQQKVDYKIDVQLDTLKHSLIGYEKITYYNNSPDTLKFIYFHLYPNATKSKTKTALAKQLLYNNDFSLYFEKEENLGYIDSLHFKINQQESQFKILKDSIDIGILYLNEPLLPNQSITIETPFYVKIPIAGHTRMGYKNNIYGITQWFPKPAVYDSKGWHPYPYLENGEYFSEFGKFDVNITLPKSYTVAATGCLQNKNEWNRINKIVELSKTYTHADTFYKKLNELNEAGTKTLQFIQDSIHDFAWFASPLFKIAHDSIWIKTKKVETWAYYIPQDEKYWNKAAQYVAQSIKYYSDKVGFYPYNHCTAVEMPYITKGGMEYPMITSIGQTNNTQELFQIILHEVGHNWFYGILANDERQQPWIDEGINTFYEMNYKNKNTIIPKNDWQRFNKMMEQSIFPDMLLIDYFYFGGFALPIGLKSEKYTNIEYYFNAYTNASSVFYFIKKYLNNNRFHSIINELYRKKSFQHVNENDIKEVFNKSDSSSIDWFFNHYLNSTRRSDYKIKKICSNDTSTTIYVKNKNKANFPFSLHFYPKDSSMAIIENIQQGFSKGIQAITLNQSIKKGTKIIINNHNSTLAFLESNYNNNTYTYRSFLPRLKRFSFRFAGIIDQQDAYDILFFPLAAYNAIDKTMIGLLLYAPQFPYPSFQFRLLPLYSTNNNKLNGSYLIEKNIPINQIVQNIRTSLFYQTYSLPKNFLQSNWQNLKFKIEIPLILRNDLNRWNFVYSFDLNYATLPFYPFNHELYFLNKISSFKQFNIYKTELNLLFENNHNFAKCKLMGRISFPYNSNKKTIDIDYFFGTFLFNHSHYGIYNLFLSGINGINDYTYNEVFVDRFNVTSSNSFWQHQFVMDDGMFTTSSPIQSNHWLTSLRGSIAIPIPPPFYFYGAVGTYYHAKNAWDGSKQFPWEIGFEIRMIKNIFALYFPIKMSSDITSISNLIYGDNYLHKIRFTIRLSQINPFKYTYKIHTFFE
ncbi:MAG: M1 family metallopeptidase [Bacteroidales bacterium]